MKTRPSLTPDAQMSGLRLRASTTSWNSMMGAFPLTRSPPLRDHELRDHRLDCPRGGRAHHQRARRGRRRVGNERGALSCHGRTGEVRARRRHRRCASRHFVFARAAVTRTAFAEEAGRRLSPSVARQASPTRRSAGRSGRRSVRSTRPGTTPGRRAAPPYRRRASPVRPAVLQPRLLRGLDRRLGRGDRSPSARDRPVRAVPRIRQGRFRFDPIRDEPGFKELVGDQD